MNEDAAMRSDDDMECLKYPYRNLRQSYLTNKTSIGTGLPLNPEHRSTREKVYLLSKSFWNITLP